MDLQKQQDTAAHFRNWFTTGNHQLGQGVSVKTTLEKNRARYRMILEDEAERKELGLSALASTKSCSIVDNAVVDAVQEYHAPDAISFTTSEDSDSSKEHAASFLTKLFHIRAKKNGFWVWHLQSLKAGLVDGIEAGMVRWRKESYKYPDNHFYDLRTGQEISEEEYKQWRKVYPIYTEGQFDPEKGKSPRIKTRFDQHFRAERTKKERIVADTWECIQLKPGENLLWDFKNPLLDLNRGQWCIVIIQMQAADILNNCANGMFSKKLTLEELKPYLTNSSRSAAGSDYTDQTSFSADPDTVDAGDFNTAEVWAAFERKGNQWLVSFSLAGEKELSDEESVNDVYFGGRPFDRLPVAMGASDIELWEALGRGIPKLIAPIEDELTDHKNNLNDIAKQAATGKYRVNEDSDVDLNALLNDKVFFAKPGEVEKLDFAQEMAVVVRASDSVSSDIASLAPVSMADNSLVGRGNAKDTLGSVQLALGGNNQKLSVRLMVRNVTFMEPMLRIIAEMEMAFETSQAFGLRAMKGAKLDTSANGPMMTVIDGKAQVDFSQLDFDAEVQCNAGLGNVPKQQKVQRVLQWEAWASTKGLPVDIEEVDRQVKVLNGFNEDQFILPPDKRPQPPPPPVEYRATVNIDLNTLMTHAPEAGQFLLDKLMSGGMSVTAAVKEPKTPDYLKPLDGSPSHPMVQHQAVDQYQNEMEGM